MKKAKKDIECYECDLKFTLQYKSKKIPQCCPFCGEGIHVPEDTPFLKDFDEYDNFDDVDYFTENEDWDEDEDE